MFDPTAPRYWAAACQTDFPCPADRSEIRTHLDRMLEMIEQTVVGYRLAQAGPGPFEKVVVAPIDLPALCHARQTRKGHQTLNDLRRNAYSVYRRDS